MDEDTNITSEGRAMHQEIIDALIGIHEATAHLQFPVNAYQNARPAFHKGDMADDAFLAIKAEYTAAMEVYDAAYAKLAEAMEKHDADPELDIYMDWGAEEAQPEGQQIALI